MVFKNICVLAIRMKEASAEGLSLELGSKECIECSAYRVRREDDKVQAHGCKSSCGNQGATCKRDHINITCLSTLY